MQFLGQKGKIIPVGYILKIREGIVQDIPQLLRGIRTVLGPAISHFTENFFRLGKKTLKILLTRFKESDPGVYEILDIIVQHMRSPRFERN